MSYKFKELGVSKEGGQKMNDKCISDFIKELIAMLHSKNTLIPFENERPWHELFYELKCEHEAPLFFNKLRFDWDGPYPRSREISDFLHALHWNASVSASNPSFDEISLSKEMATLWLGHIDHSEPSNLNFLNIALKKAENKFKQMRV